MNSDGSALAVITSGGGVQEFTFKPDGSMAVVQVQEDRGQKVRIIRRDGSIVFEQPGASKPLWSPDGSRLAIVVGEAAQVLDGSGDVIRSVSAATRPAWAPGWNEARRHPDRRRADLSVT